MLETDTLTGLFQRLLRTATQAQRIPMSEQTECYLVQMLAAFVRPPERDLLDPPLGVEYLTALNLPAGQRFARLRRVADTALFLTGLFLEHLENTLVGGEYYATLGRSAYARLSADEPHADLAEAFADLSRRFGAFVRILGEISDRELFNSDRDTLRLYRRWLLTRGPREAELLVRRGVIPFAAPGTTRH
jgi:hypothetical protein